MSLPSSFKSEPFRLINNWKRQSVPDEYFSVCSNLSAKRADSIFFPKVRERLKILASLPMGTTEVERLLNSEDRHILGFATQ